jgi:hypothetical protein
LPRAGWSSQGRYFGYKRVVHWRMSRRREREADRNCLAKGINIRQEATESAG